MKSISKLYIIGGVALVLSVIAGLGFVVASGSEKRWDGGFHAPPLHRGFHSENFSRRVLSRMDEHMELLHLTGPQQAKYEEIRGRIEKRLTEGMKDRKKLREDIRIELNKETPDMHLVSGMVKHRISSLSAFLEENLDLMVELYDMLDEKQKAQVIEHMRCRAGGA